MYALTPSGSLDAWIEREPHAYVVVHAGRRLARDLLVIGEQSGDAAGVHEDHGV